MGTGKFTPGTSGNPSGRPPGRGLKAEIEAALREDRAGYMSRATMIAQKLVDMAEDGDIRAIELLLKRIWPEKVAIEQDGMVTLTLIDLSGKRKEEGPAGRVIDHSDEQFQSVVDSNPVAELVADSERNPTFAKAIPAESEAQLLRQEPPPVPVLTIQKPWLDRGRMQTEADQ